MLEEFATVFITCNFVSFKCCLQKEKRTLLAKRLDLDACKTKVRKAQSPEKIQQVSIIMEMRQEHVTNAFFLKNLMLIKLDIVFVTFSFLGQNCNDHQVYTT